MNVFVLGANGFIGHHLVRAILERTGWRLAGIDLASHRLRPWLGHARFEFREGDVGKSHDWIDRAIERADVVLPLVAIATPIDYVRRPLDVFRMTFEENLRIVRRCVEAGTRLVFPSSSEVYGMCADETFDEERSPLVLGPVPRQRWIYACSKQLLERVIWAYGVERKLRFTLFRPFNWIGPGLDDPGAPAGGSSRVVAQFMGNLMRGEPMQLVGGGAQRRCFTYVDDGIAALLRVIDDPAHRCDGAILNLGAPGNECSIRELAERLSSAYRAHPLRQEEPRVPPTVVTTAEALYGVGYQDVDRRVPSIDKARLLLGWEPRVGLDEALSRALDATLREPTACRPAAAVAG